MIFKIQNTRMRQKADKTTCENCAADAGLSCVAVILAENAQSISTIFHREIMKLSINNQIGLNAYSRVVESAEGLRCG